MEIWKDIEGWPGYSVSNEGYVLGIEGAILSPQLCGVTGKKYYYVRLSNRGVCKSKSIHRMVALAFVSNPENNPIVDHINGDKLDNRAINLRWVTYSDNALNPNTQRDPGAVGHKHINMNRKLFRVLITRNYKTVFRQTFKTLAEAITARDKFISLL